MAEKEVDSRYKNSENELRKALDELSNAERTHSAISALVVQNQDRRASQEKIVRSIEEKGSVAIVQTVVDDVRMAEESSGTPFTATAKEPENVVAHIDRLLEKESKEAPQMLSPELGVYLTDVLVNHMVRRTTMLCSHIQTAHLNSISASGIRSHQAMGSRVSRVLVARDHSASTATFRFTRKM